MAIAERPTTEPQRTEEPQEIPSFPIQQILVPLDGSRYAEAALTLAGELAVRANASITVVHAAIPRDVSDLVHAVDLEEATLGGHVILARATRRLAELEVPVAELLVLPREGELPSAPGAILTALRHTGADLVVMTTHGWAGMSRVMVGSVADAVIRRCAVPVLLVPPRPRAGCARLAGDETSAHPPAVLVALDGTPESESALEPAAALASAIGGGLELLRVVPEQHLLLGPSLGLATTTRGTWGYLAQVAETLLDTHLTLRFARTAVRVADSDKVAAAVSEHAESIGATTIALATHGRGSLARLLVGSVTARVVATAAVPVLVVPPHVGA